MFGDTDIYEDIAEFLLEMYDLEDILEMNNLTDVDALALLIEGGSIGHPRAVLDRLQSETGHDEEA